MEKCIKKIGIIGAMDSEISVLRSIMKENGSLKQTEAGNCTFNEGVINGVSAVVVKSGVGKVNAALCAQRLILQSLGAPSLEASSEKEYWVLAMQMGSLS